jgi:hypothetical protein
MRSLLRRILLISFAMTLAFSLPLEAFAKGSPRGGGSTRGTTSKGSTTSVRGYTKKDGTYVAPHHRTSPDSSKNNNWSTKSNQNPYTGKPGTKEP